MFEIISTLFENFNFFGIGATIFYVALVGIIARGMSSLGDQINLYIIALSIFGFVTLLSQDYSAPILFIIGSLAVLYYSLKHLKSKT